jgi:hypothetical protein
MSFCSRCMKRNGSSGRTRIFVSTVFYVVSLRQMASSAANSVQCSGNGTETARGRSRNSQLG